MAESQAVSVAELKELNDLLNGALLEVTTYKHEYGHGHTAVGIDTDMDVSEPSRHTMFAVYLASTASQSQGPAPERRNAVSVPYSCQLYLHSRMQSPAPRMREKGTCDAVNGTTQPAV